MKPFKLTPVSVVTSKSYQSQWLIKHVMEDNSLGMVFGAPAAGKSLIVMDIAFCVAVGLDWNGNKTKQGKVVYLAGEGFNGIGKRFKALSIKYGMVANDIFLSELPASLTESASAEAVRESIDQLCPNPALIVIDTLHRNFGAGDENSSKDFALFLFIIDTVIKTTGATVLIVHHSGHGESNRARGSSAIKAAMDFEYKISKSGDLVTMEATKTKEFDAPSPMSFNLVTQPIQDWLDDDGRPVESVVLNSVTYTVPARKQSLTKKDHLILQALNDAVVKNGKPAPKSAVERLPELAGKNLVHLDDWRVEAYRLIDKGDTKKPTMQQAFNRSRAKLLGEGKVAEVNNCFWEMV